MKWIAFGLCGLLAACATDIQLTAKNSSKDLTQAARVVYRDSLSTPEQTVSLGNVAPGSSATSPLISVKVGGTFRLEGVLSDALVYKGAEHSVPREPNPFPITEEMTTQSIRVLPNDATSTIASAFKNLGVPLLPDGSSMQSALQSYFGALIVVTRGDDTKPPKIHYRIPPDVLGVKIVDLAAFLALLPDNSESEHEDITKTSALSLSATLPFFSKTGLDFNSSDVFYFDWKLAGYGWVAKPEDASKTVTAQYQKLSAEDRRQIANALKANPGSTLIYVNSLYAIKTAEVKVKRGVKVNATANIQPVVATASGAYGYADNYDSDKSYNNSILNASGDEFVPLAVTLSDDTSSIATSNVPFDSLINSVHASIRASEGQQPGGNGKPKATVVLVPTGHKVQLPGIALNLRP